MAVLMSEINMTWSEILSEVRSLTELKQSDVSSGRALKPHLEPHLFPRGR
jgi:hypothetical protein